MTVAALYVAEDGPYVNRPGVDAWPESRDARKYRGPHRVVCHCPCERWGRFAEGGPSAAEEYELGDDGGCMEHGVWAVRTFGGVLEQPEGSHAFEAFGLPRPPVRGWSPPDQYGGRSCAVDQGVYGHRAKKPTWLYAVLPSYPKLNWTKVWDRPRVGGDGFRSRRERERAKASSSYQRRERITDREILLTPPPFAKLLIELASLPGVIRRGPRQVLLGRDEAGVVGDGPGVEAGHDDGAGGAGVGLGVVPVDVLAGGQEVPGPGLGLAGGVEAAGAVAVLKDEDEGVHEDGEAYAVASGLWGAR